MSDDKIQEPIYDDRVNATIRGLIEGKTREELAEGFQLSSWKSLDIYMRRKGFTWDGANQAYIPAANKVDKILEEVSSSIPVKAQQVIRKFEQCGKDADPREIAIELGFDDHRDMAQYMERKGLSWDSDKGNYVETLVGCLEEKESKKEEVKSTNEFERNEIKEADGEIADDMASMLRYMPLLEMLSENKERLLDLLMPSAEGNIPKYAIPGTPKTKSIYMSDLLARLVGEFSDAKNLSQREIVEAAIVEYLRRYGYKPEMDRLLAKR